MQAQSVTDTLLVAGVSESSDLVFMTYPLIKQGYTYLINKLSNINLKPITAAFSQKVSKLNQDRMVEWNIHVDLTVH